MAAKNIVRRRFFGRISPVGPRCILGEKQESRKVQIRRKIGNPQLQRIIGGSTAAG
jgi:hypothetical protein